MWPSFLLASAFIVASLMSSDVESSVTFTHWGRSRCGSGEALIYKGIMAGPSGVRSSSKSVGSTFLCMPDSPEYNNSDSGVQRTYGQVFAAEFDVPSTSRILETDNAEDDGIEKPADFDGHVIPCAVCFKDRATTQLMIPGRSRCVNQDEQGWQAAYDGYLMAGSQSAQRAYYDKYLTDAVCVDKKPEVHAMGRRNDYYAAKASFIEAQCNDLPCPGFNNGKELTCVLCIN